MSRKDDKKKLKAFQLKNFHAFINHWRFGEFNKGTGEKIEIEPDSLMCPICWNIDHIDNFFEEHAPPKSIGGKVVALTCDCNNKAGSIIEGSLKKRVSFDAYGNGKSVMKFDAHYNIDGFGESKGSIELSPFGDYKITLSNPFHKKNPKFEQLETLLRDKSGTIKGKINFNLPDRKPPYIALVKSAYIIAFSHFGYGLFLNDNMKYVRSQILNPEKDILPIPMGVSSNLEDSNHVLGVNVFDDPGKACGYLVIFNAKYDKQQQPLRYGVLLPGPGEIGKNVYGIRRLGGILHTIDKKFFVNNMDASILFNLNWGNNPNSDES
jgi:hypothetical protein